MAKKKRKSQSKNQIDMREKIIDTLIDLIVGLALTTFGCLLDHWLNK